MIDDKNTHTPHDSIKEARKAKAEAADYDVGYCKPPKRGQIKKGERRNPNGRPKKKPDDFDELFVEEGNKTIEIVENGKRRKVTRNRAVVMLLYREAISGKQWAVNAIMKKSVPTGQFDTKLDSHEDRGGGVLVVPAGLTLEEWEREAEAYRQKVLDEGGNIRDEFTY